MSYNVCLVNNETKELVMIKENYKWEDHSWWWWAEGNMSCDCNRRMQWNCANGIDSDWDKDIHCGETAFSIPFIVLEDGRVEEIDERKEY